MTSEQKIAWAVVAAVVAGLVVVSFLPKVGEALAPEPRAAWVAVELEGSGLAVVGGAEFPAGTPFRLYAVLEADRDGEPLYYTEAPALAIGGRQVPAEAIRRWDRPHPVKVLWFTVEGRVPFLELEPGQGLDRFFFESFFRPEWGFEWTAEGSLDPAHDNQLIAERRLPRLPFGTQRYQVRIEIFDRDRERELVPRVRFTSPGPEGLPGAASRRDGGGPGAGVENAGSAASGGAEAPDTAAAAAAPSGPAAAAPSVVTATLPGPAGPASAVFGLTEIAPPSGADEQMRVELLRLTRSHYAFGRLELLATVLEAAGRKVEDLAWERIDLEGDVPWGQVVGSVAPGDLLRVGDRVVMLYRDADDGGRPGGLDRADLCFDYVAGAAVRPLGHVFAAQSRESGETGEVEWASLGRSGGGRP